VVFDVPADATSISFGVLRSGPGQLLMNQVTIKTFGAETDLNRSSGTFSSPSSISRR
jgi:hypothetical protein